MTRLLVDQIRRGLGNYGAPAAFTALIWVIAPDLFSVRIIVAWSLFVTCFTGPFRSSVLTVTRELTLLPVSWRDRWRAQWAIAVVFPVLVTSVGELVGLAVAAALGKPRQNPELILVTAFCDAGYAGLASGLLTTVRRKNLSMFAPRRRWPMRLVLGWALAPFVLVFLGGLSGFLLYPFVPTDLNALRGPLGLFIAVGLGTGAWTWFYWSANGPRPMHFGRLPTSGWRPPSGPLPLEARGPGGVYRLLHFGLSTAMRRAVVCATLVLPFLFIANRDFVKVLWAMLVLMFGFVDWQRRLRPLRQLPISVFGLNAVMLSTTITLWLVTLLAMRGAAFIAPSRADIVPIVPFGTAIIAVHVLMQSLMLQNKSSYRFAFLVMFLATRILPKAFWEALPSVTAAQVPWLSLAAIVVAVFMNHRTLTRSTTAYKPRSALASRLGAPETS